MNDYTILLNQRFSGSPITLSELELSDDYLVYTQSLGGGVTDEFNVRVFLNDPSNETIATNFIAYLNDNTTEAERSEILYDNRKLSVLFNQYYQSSAVNNAPLPTVFIDEQLTNTINLIISDNHFLWDGEEFPRPTNAPATIINSTRSPETREFLYEYTNEDSYYIPIHIKKSYDKTAIETFKVCDDTIDVQIQPELAESFFAGIIDANEEFFEALENNSPDNPSDSVRISSILQCFVDTNFETNENLIFNNNARQVSFLSDRGIYLEGTSVQIPLALSAPSALGIEQLELQIVYGTGTEDDVAPIGGEDFFFVNWAEGEQFKNVQLSINSDIFIEGIENLRIEFVNTLNCVAGQFDSHIVAIEDNTVLREVGFTGEGGVISSSEGRGNIVNYDLNEGENLELEITLDQPSITGQEEIQISFYNYASENGAALLGDDFSLIGEQTVRWELGEQSKTIQINVLHDDLFEELEEVSVRLTNPVGLIFNPTLYPSEAVIRIGDATRIRRYSSLRFANFYKQKGQNTNDFDAAQLRVLTDTETTQDSNSWLIPLGHQYSDTTETFNQNFGSYPNFGFSENQLNPKVFVEIVNLGDEAITFNSIRYEVGETIEVAAFNNSFDVILPSNTGLIQQGDIDPLTGMEATSPTFTESKYQIKLRYDFDTIPEEGIDYGPNRFVLKDSFQNSIIDLGEYDFPVYENAVVANLNRLYMQSKYVGIATNYNGLCTTEFGSEQHKQNAKINGFIFLDESSNATSLSSVEFNSSNNLNNICDTVSGNAGFLGNWTSVLFEIFEPTITVEQSDNQVER